MYFRPYGVVSVSKSSLAVFLLIVHPSQTGLEGQAIARMMSNGWIDSWRHSFPRINRQVEIGQYLAVNSPIPRRAHVGLKEQRSHVPVLSQLLTCWAINLFVFSNLSLSLHSSTSALSGNCHRFVLFPFFFFILFSRGFFLYLCSIDSGVFLFSFVCYRFVSLSLFSIAAVPVHVHVPIATHPPDHTIWQHHQFDNGESLLLFLPFFRPLMSLRRTMI